jgi:hypothetical protein
LSIETIVALCVAAALISTVGCSTSTMNGRSTVSSAPDDDAAGAQEQGASSQLMQSWRNPPLQIEGRWMVNGCPGKADMVIELTLQDTKVAVANVVEPGAAMKYGYRPGEKILELEANLYGNWRGKAKWRSVTSVERWDPIYFTMEGETLTARMTTDHCFSRLNRVE